MTRNKPEAIIQRALKDKKRTGCIIITLLTLGLLISILPISLTLAAGDIIVAESSILAHEDPVIAQMDFPDANGDGAVFDISLVTDTPNTFNDIYIASNRSSVDAYCYWDGAEWVLIGQQTDNREGVRINTDLISEGGTSAPVVGSDTTRELKIKVISAATGMSRIAFGIDAGCTADYAVDRDDYDISHILQQQRYPVEFSNAKAKWIGLTADESDEYPYPYILTALLLNAKGKPVEGQTVLFTIVSGDRATLSVSHAISDVDGIAVVKVYSNAPGEVVVQARTEESLTTTVTVVFDDDVMPISYGADADSVAAAINAYGYGGGSGAPLSASVSNINEVTVTGSVTNANTSLALDVDANVTIKWNATLTGSTSNGLLPEDALVYINYGGMFEMLNGLIEQNGSDNALSAAGDIKICNGGITAKSGRALYAEGDITVSDGIISAAGSEGRAIALSRRDFIMEGGEINTTGNAVFAARDIIVIDGVVAAVNGTAMTAFNGNIFLYGGTISSVDSYALYALGGGGIGGNIIMSGSTVSSATDIAIIANGIIVNSGNMATITNSGINPAVRLNTDIYIDHGKLTINGNADLGSNGIHADNDAIAKVNGNIESSGNGVTAFHSSTVTIDGGIVADSYGAVAGTAATVTINGNIEAGVDGVNAGLNDTTVTVTGSIKAGNNGVTASGGAMVSVSNNVKAGSFGVYGTDGAKVVVDGEIDAGGTYIYLYNRSNIGNEETYLAFADHSASSKPGYREYTDGKSFVWVVDRRIVLTVEPGEDAYANNFDTYSLTALLLNAKGIPVEGQTVLFTIISGDGAALSAASAVTNASGKAIIRMSSSLPGEVLVRASADNVLADPDPGSDALPSDVISVVFLPVEYSSLADSLKAESPARQNVTRISGGYSNFRVSAYDIAGNRLDFPALIGAPPQPPGYLFFDKPGQSIGENAVVDQAYQDTIIMSAQVIMKPSGSMLLSRDIRFAVHSSGGFDVLLPFDRMNIDGDYEVNIFLANGENLTFTVCVTNQPKSVSVGLQAGSLKAGEAGTVTFPVTTANINNSMYPVTVANLPPGVSAQGQVFIYNGAGTLTLTGDTSTVAGSARALTLTIDDVLSDPFTLTISQNSSNVSIGGGGGSGVGGGGGGGGGPVSISAGNGAVSLMYSLSDGVTTLFLLDSEIKDILEASANNNVVAFDLSRVPNGSGVTVSKDKLKELVDGGLPLQFKLCDGTITLDAGAVKSAVAQANGTNITLSLQSIAQASLTEAQQAAVKPDDLIFNISASSGVQTIKNFDGTLTVSVPYEGPLPATVWYLDSTGNLELLISSYNAQTKTATFKTDHLSLYVVGGPEAEGALRIKLAVGALAYTVGGVQRTMDTAPEIIDGRTMVPLRFIAEALGAKVDWDDKSSTATVEMAGRTLLITIGERAPGMDVPAMIMNSRTMVPLRYVSETLGCEVVWNPEARTIEIVK